MSAGPIRISILADGSKATRTFASVGGSANGMGLRVGKSVRGIGLAAGAGFAVAGVAAAAWAKSSVTSLARIERINAQTAQTIKSTGGAARVNAKHVEALAGRLEKLTTTEAESTQEGANLLLTFTNIQNRVGKGNKIFDRATGTLVDMSRALGTEPRAAAIQLGKALNDPVKGVTALTKVGVSFTDQQKGQIKSLTESGKRMQAQKIILGELNKEFGGSGKAFAKTAEGQKAALENAFGDLGEKIFAPLLPWLTKATAKTTVFINYLTANVGPAFQTVAGYVGPVVDRLRDLFDTSDAGTSRISSGVTSVLSTYQKFYATFIPIILAVAAAITERWGQIEPQVRAIWGSVQRTITSALQIIQSVVGIATGLVLAIWAKFGDTITRYVGRALVATITILRGAFQIVEGIFKTVSAVLRGDWRGAWDGIKKIVSGALTVVRGSLSLGMAAVRALASAGLSILKTIAAKAWDGVKSAFTNGIGASVRLVSALPAKVVNAIPSPLTILSGVGGFIIQGLRNGIDAAAHLVTGAVEAIINKIPAKVRKLMGIESPSKVMRALARWIPAGLAAGIEDGSSGIEKSIKAVTDRVEKAFDTGLDRTKKRIDRKYDVIEKRLRKNLKGDKLDKALNRNDKARDNATDRAEKNSNKGQRDLLAAIRKQLPALRANGRAQDAIAEAIKTAKDNLADLQKQQADYAASVRDTITAAGSLSTLGEGDGFGSVEQLISQRTAAVAKAAQFSSVIEQLRGRLNDTDLQNLIDQGAAGLGTASAILGGGDGAIAQLNALQGQLSTIGTNLGATASQQFHGAGVAAAQGIVAGLEAEAKNLDAQAVRLANALVKAVKRALKIKSPSRVFMGIGDNVTKGLGIGLDDTYVRRSGASLAASLQKGFGAPALDAWVAAGGVNASSSQTLSLRLSAQEVDQLARGRSLTADTDAWASLRRPR